MRGLAYRRDVTLDARYREVPLALRHPTPEQLEWAKETLAKPRSPGPSVQSLAYAKWFLEIADDPETTPVPLQTLRIGDICIGTMPCEAFAEIGLEFRTERHSSKPSWSSLPMRISATCPRRVTSRWAVMKRGSGPIAWSRRRP